MRLPGEEVFRRLCSPLVVLFLCLTACTVADTGEVISVPLPANEMLHDPTRGTLLASISSRLTGFSNSVARIDPVNGAITASIAFDAEPQHLALANNGRYLYVTMAHTSTVSRIDLENWSVDLAWDLGNCIAVDGPPQPWIPECIAVLGDHPETVAISLTGCQSTPRHRGIVVFDNGVDRPVRGDADRGCNVIVSSADGTRLYGFSSDFQWYRRLSVTSEGVSYLDPGVWLAGTSGIQIKLADGILYTHQGYAIEPENSRVRGRYTNWPWLEASGFEPDANAGRFFVVVSRNWNESHSYQITAFDLLRFTPVGTLSIPDPEFFGGEPTTPRNLIRFGADGIAFLTARDELFLVRSRFFHSPSSADLSVLIHDSPDPAFAGETVNYSIVITNAGPDSASSVMLTNTLPANAQLLSSQTTRGSITHSGTLVIGNIGTLQKGESVTVTIAIKSGAAGMLTDSATVSTAEFDPVDANNTHTQATIIDSPPRTDAIRCEMLGASHLVYDTNSGRLFADVSSGNRQYGNQIVEIDPVTGRVVWTADTGSEPRKLALSQNGSFAYVALQGSGSVRRFDLSGASQPTEFWLGAEWDGTFFPDDIACPPGLPETVAVHLQVRGTGDNPIGIAIYDNGVQRPQIARDYATSIAFSDSANRLYGYNGVTTGFDIYRFDVTPDGIVKLDATGGLCNGWDWNIRYYDGRLFNETGQVVAPEERGRAGKLLTWGLGIAFDAARKLVFYVSYLDGWQIVAYDQDTLRAKWFIPIPGVADYPIDLVRWGEDGFAFLTTGGQLYLVRTQYLSATPQANLRLTLFDSPDPTILGNALTYQMRVHNAGPATATKVALTATLSTNVTLLKDVAGQSTLTISNNLVFVRLPDLASNATATVSLIVQPETTGVLRSSASVFADQPDSDLTDNYASQPTYVAPTGTTTLVSVLDLPCNGLISDVTGSNLYASTPGWLGWSGNALVSINPTTQEVTPVSFLGCEPERIRLSDNGRYLYAISDVNSTVRRLNVEDSNLDMKLRFGAFPGLSCAGEGMVDPLDFEISPGAPELIAVTRTTSANCWAAPGPHNLGLYDAGAIRPVTNCSGDKVVFGADSSRLYGIYQSQLARFDATASGVTTLDLRPGIVTGDPREFKFVGGLLWCSSGDIVDPEAGALLAHIGANDGVAVVPDLQTGRAFFLSTTNRAFPQSALKQITAIDTTTYAWIDQLSFEDIPGKPNHLARWGDRGLAFTTDADLLVLVRSSLVKDSPADDPDGDGIPSAVDNCPSVFNPMQTDADGNSVGDACDVHPRVFDLTLQSIDAPARVKIHSPSSTASRNVKVTVINHSLRPVVVPNAQTLASLVKLEVPLHGDCDSPVLELMAPRKFPISIPAGKTYKLHYRVTFRCPNAPRQNQIPHFYMATADPIALENSTDLLPADNVCPRPANPVRNDPGCGTFIGRVELHLEVRTEVIVQ